MVNDKDLLRLDEVAQRLSISRTAAYELAHCGSLPVVRIGRSVRVPISLLEHWINARVSESSPAETEGEEHRG